MAEDEKSGKRQIFVFELDGEDYALDIEGVREIIKAEDKEITEVPNVPEFISGITNVRGKVVPVIDLEEKLSLDHHESNYIVIIELNDTPAGILVDDVQEVMRVERERIQDAPEILEQKLHREFIKEVVVFEENMIVILDLVAGLEEHEEVAVEQVKDTMETETEEETEEISQQDAEKAAAERVSEDEEKQEETGEEGSEEDNEEKDQEDEDATEDENTDGETEGQEEDDTEDQSSDEESEEGDSEEEEETGEEQDEEDQDEGSGSGDLTCDECGEGFDSKRELASHKVQEH